MRTYHWGTLGLAMLGLPLAGCPTGDDTDETDDTVVETDPVDTDDSPADTDDTDASADGITLEADLSSGQPVGSMITWTATLDTPTSATYTFAVAASDGVAAVVRDHGPDATFEWVPVQEDTYTVSVTAHLGETELTASMPFAATSAITGDSAVVTELQHPLTALYSVPACGAGSQVQVRFRRAGSDDDWFATDSRACLDDRSTSFVVGGMRADTEYELMHVVDEVSESTLSTFTTGSVPTDLPVPTFAVEQGPSEHTSSERLLLYSAFMEDDEGSYVLPIATDLDGEIVWYYGDEVLVGGAATLTTHSDGGSFFLLVGDEEGDQGQYLREVDIAGRPLHEISVETVNDKLVLDGAPHLIGGFDHEAIRLPNGHIAVQCSMEEIIDLDDPPAGLESGEDVDVLGYGVVVLDESWQVVWHWDPFEELDVERTTAQAYEIYCEDNAPGCPALELADKAYDWMHGNALAYSPADGNLIYSLRNQDWVLKLNYADGSGTPEVVWVLGKDAPDGLGFTGPADDEWFSHQHGANYVSDDTITLFDNSNLRCLSLGAPADCKSRGQVLVVDETEMTATYTLNVDMPYFSVALGMAQELSNGNYHFTVGAPITNTDLDSLQNWLSNGLPGESVEVERNDGDSLGFDQSGDWALYRSYRLTSLYAK